MIGAVGPRARLRDGTLAERRMALDGTEVRQRIADLPDAGHDGLHEVHVADEVDGKVVPALIFLFEFGLPPA